MLLCEQIRFLLEVAKSDIEQSNVFILVSLFVLVYFIIKLTYIIGNKFITLKAKGNVMKSDAENDIVEAVKGYIEIPDTRYAIMIDGEWGSGKTYLWRNTLLPIVGKSESIYISLFGLKDVNDIENEIFKALSSMGADDEGILKGILNAGTASADGIRIGGIGFAAHFMLKKWKEKIMKKSKTLLICFDDLERWSGNIEVCLSYINKLTEQDGTKCLVIGNTREIKDKEIFNKTKEKTIRFIYKLTHTPEITLKASVDLAHFPTSDCKKNIENFLKENKHRIYDLLKSANCSNIRIVSTAICYFSKIYFHNKVKFDISPANAISYFISLLSILILVEQYKTNDTDKEIILASSSFYESIKKLNLNIIYENRAINKLSNEDEIACNLLYKVLYKSNQAKYHGKFSIIKCGFYKTEDFEDEFSNWKKTEDYEYLLGDDREIWTMDDDKFNHIYQNTYKAMFQDKTIRNPRILLALANRILNDIKRGVVKRNFDITEKKVKLLFERFYTQKEMEYVPIDSWTLEPFYNGNCSNFIKEFNLIERNKIYNESYRKENLQKIWVKLKENPNEIDNIMKWHRHDEIFAMYNKPEEVVEAIESLENDQLFEFSDWMGARLKDSAKAVEKEHEGAQAVVKVLEEKYKDSFGIKAGHIKQIIRILKNKSTNY
jgi:hypothetical protein